MTNYDHMLIQNVYYIFSVTELVHFTHSGGENEVETHDMAQ